jgi:GMP synthase (glutamine-hydrolysing)
LLENITPEDFTISASGSEGSFDFDPASFVEEKVAEIRSVVGKGRAAIATSGGVDSTACAALAHRALGKDLVCFFMDTGFMREGEVKEVKGLLASLGLPLKILSVKDRFLKALEGKTDAESKRLAFRETFYTVLGEAAGREGCDVLIQGTIAPDWIESSGGIKTQHNVLEQLGVDTVKRFGFRLLEPLLDLYKDQVRALARYLGASVDASERQPFPGPGLLVRCIGPVSEEKVEVLRRATSVVEEELGAFRPAPKQYLAAVIEDERSPSGKGVEGAASQILPKAKVEYFRWLATGVKGDNRAYGKIAIVSGEEREPSELFGLPEKVIHEDGEIVRVVYKIDDGRKRAGKYAVIVRAVETRDFMTARPSTIPLKVLKGIADKIMEDGRVSVVCYDLTSKPPATVEFE